MGDKLGYGVPHGAPRCVNLGLRTLPVAFRLLLVSADGVWGATYIHRCAEALVSLLWDMERIRQAIMFRRALAVKIYARLLPATRLPCTLVH
jgi:hypothetical protein